MNDVETEYVLAYVTAQGVFRGWITALGEPGRRNPSAGGSPYAALRFTDRAEAERVAAEQAPLVRRFNHLIEVTEAPPADPPLPRGRWADALDDQLLYLLWRWADEPYGHGPWLVHQLATHHPDVARDLIGRLQAIVDPDDGEDST